MNGDDLDIPNIKSYWIKEADEALTVAEHLFEKGDYSYALFFGHLAVEKILRLCMSILKRNTHHRYIICPE